MKYDLVSCKEVRN